MKEKRQLFNEAISYWPEEIQITKKELLSNGAARIPELTKIHDDVEKSILLVKDNYLLRQMDWAIYTVLHNAAKSLDILILSEIDYSAVESFFDENTKK